MEADTAVMLLHRRYAVALLLAVALAVAYAVIPRIADGIRAEQARQDLAAATAALHRLKRPAGFVQLDSGSDCPAEVWYRCYLVAKPTDQVATSIPGLLSSIDAQTHQGLIGRAVHLPRCSTTAPLRGYQLCAYSGLIDHSVIAVFLSSYRRRQAERWVWTNDSEVDITPPIGLP